MTQEEKLSKFYDLSIGSANEQKEKMVSEYRTALEADFETHKSEKESAVSERLKAEKTELRRELQRELSDRQGEIRRKMAGRQREVRDEIFANVKDKLTEFRKTPEYQTWLFKSVKAAKEFAGEDKVTVRDDIFTNVKDKLPDMRRIPENHTWLFRNIKAARDIAGESNVIIYVDPDDAAYMDEIEAACQVKPIVSDEAFGGGIRAVIRSKRILIDNSFDTLIEEEKEHFRFDGGNLNG